VEKSKNLLQQVLDTLPIPVYCKDREGRYFLGNRSFQDFMGLAEEAWLGKTSVDISPPHLGPIYHQSDRLLLENGETLQYETVVEAASGLRQIVVTKNVMRSQAGEITGIVGAYQDITERKQAEEERRQLDERISQMQRLESLGVLVAGVAHNFNNILAVILGLASVHEEMETDHEVGKALALINKAAVRGRDLVHALMKFARPSLVKIEPLEINRLLTEVRLLLEATTRNRIEIQESFAGGALWVNGDAGDLNHAIMNLCLNAVDAMPQGGVLTFRTAGSERGWVDVHVEDSGEGIAPDVLARVLEPFFTTKDVGKGTGLGLSLAHGVIKAHGGTMEICSAPGRGTAVKLRLPRIPAPAPIPAAEVGPSRLGSLKVLLVDDESDLREMEALMLHQAGCVQVETAASGQEALERLSSGYLPDLVILDQNMPRMDGAQTLEKIRARHPDMWILIASGQPEIEEWTCFTRARVAVISKPFAMPELLAKLAGMLQGT